MKKDKLKIAYKVLFWLTVPMLILSIFLLIQGMTSPVNAYRGILPGTEESVLIEVNYGSLQNIINNGFANNIFEIRSLLLPFKESGVAVNDIINGNGDVVIAAGTEWNDGYQLVLNFANTTLSGFIIILMSVATGVAALIVKICQIKNKKK